LPPARYSELEGRRVALWGLGRETLALIEALPELAPTAEVVGVVAAGEADRAKAQELGIPATDQSDAESLIVAADIVVRSPGVSTYEPDLVVAREVGKTVLTATGLWMQQQHRAPVIGVTGTKGKSTTATMVAALIEATGRSVELAGNIGRPAIELEALPTPNFYVIELSSYQLADLLAGPDFALITNLAPEHPHWHGGTERYFSDKLRMAEFDSVRGIALNVDDWRLSNLVPRAPVTWFGYGTGIEIADRSILLDGSAVAEVDAMPLLGGHNLVNFCGAMAVLEAAGVQLDAQSVRAALSKLAPLPHRLEIVPTEDGVTWVDDSISTTAESAIAAAEAFGADELILIAGGHERQQDYTELAKLIVQRGLTLICLPDTGQRLNEAARAAGADESSIHAAADLQQAVDLARALTEPGSVVLLSPGAPSFGHFKSFEERGDKFREYATQRSPAD
jgi:UDP-N-acetylmuramoylalanine--D-glutamate ligase